MQLNGWQHPWIRFIGIATAYCAALTLFRELSIPHWIILTGFHLAVLMLVDYKDWPALFVGEAVRLGYVSITCYDQYGLVWALVNVIPSIALEGPIVWWFRERWNLFPNRRSVDMPALVLCSLVVAMVATGITLGQLQLTPLPPHYIIHYGEAIGKLVLGNFVGVLTVAPFVLVVHQSYVAARRNWRQWWQEVVESRLTLECVFVVLPVLMFLTWVGFNDPHARSIAQTAMFLPVVMLAIRRGWEGAAVSGTLASLGVVFLMPEQVDHVTLQAETLVALAIATMLLVGARIEVLDRRSQQDRTDMRLALALAQRSVWLGEAQLRMSANALEQARDAFQSTAHLMLGRLRQLQPVIDDTGYRRQVQNTQSQLLRLTESLHPPQLRERGLRSVLDQGALAYLLRDAGISYRCEVRGPLSAFPQSMSLAVYRIVAEAVFDACAKKDTAGIVVRLRCGNGQRGWMVVMVSTRRHPARMQHVEWDTLLTHLRTFTTGLGRKAIEDRARTFEGRVCERYMRHGHRVVVSLQQPQDPPRD